MNTADSPVRAEGREGLSDNGAWEGLRDLQHALGHRFRDLSLLQCALTHPSYVHEHPREHVEHNQRLEFLGDAVVDFVVAHWIFEQYPDFDEGPMTRLRAVLVRTEMLADLAQRFGIGKLLRLGRGEEETGGRVRAANLCDAFEAVMGALYLDAGLDAVRAFLVPLLAPVAREVLAAEADRDAKSRLQEISQAANGITPHYRIVEEYGPDHAKVFTAEVVLGDVRAARGSGRSKQAAEQAAARAALAALSGAQPVQESDSIG